MLIRLATFHQCPGDIDAKGPYHALPLAIWTRHSMQLIPEKQRACMASAMAGPGRVEDEHSMTMTCSSLTQFLLCRGNFVLLCGSHVTFSCRGHDVQDYELEGCSQPNDYRR